MNYKVKEKLLSVILVFFLMLPSFTAEIKAEEYEGINIHGSLEGKEVLFAEETVAINAGTIFAPKVSGTMTHVKLYTAKEENGKYTVQLWDFEYREVIAEYEWNIKSGFEGWQYFELPEPIKLEAFKNYVVSVMNNENSRYYARVEGYFYDGDDVNSMFITTIDSGRFSLDTSVLPNNQFNQRTYLRDIVFVPDSGVEAPRQDVDLSSYNTVYVSDLKWGGSYSNGTQVVKDGASSFEDLIIKSKTYDKGFSMYASPREGDSFVEINVEGLGFKTFAAYVGIAELLMDGNVVNGSAVFIVSADGVEKQRTPLLKYGEDPYLFLVDISDAKILRFSVDPGDDGITGDLAGWGNAVLSKESIDKGADIFALAKPITAATPGPTEEPEATPAPSKTPVKEDEEKDDTGFIIIGIVVVSVLIVVLVIVMIVKLKKRK